MQRRRIPTLRRSTALAVLLAFLVAACGSEERGQSEPALPAGLAAELAARSDAVAAKLDAGDPCGALADAEALHQETLAAVDAGGVPPRYREQLTSAVGSLAASISCTIPPPPPAADDDEDDEDDDEDDDNEDEDDDDDDKGKKGKGNGKDKGKKGE